MWYYARGDDRVGPVDEAAFEEAIATGEVTYGTLVWREGMAGWQPWGAVQGQAAHEPGAMAACIECGNVFPRGEMLTHGGVAVCAGCKPIYFQRLQEGGEATQAYAYGGFWIRFVAKVIDSFITGIAGFAWQIAVNSLVAADTPEAVTLLMFGWYNVGGIAIGVAYSAFFLGRFGATPGKMAVGLKVIRPDGSPVTYGRGALRGLAEIVSAVIFYIGYIMAAFDDEKRALHDRMCDTRVIVAQ